jgi:hypothetical protein
MLLKFRLVILLKEAPADPIIFCLLIAVIMTIYFHILGEHMLYTKTFSKYLRL